MSAARANRSRVTGVVLICGIGALVGCRSTPVPLAPPPVPAAFVAPQLLEVTTASVVSWETLGDTTSAQLIAHAWADNPDIAALVARLEAARASAAATGAARRPTLTASSHATITRSQSPGGGSNGTSESYGLRLSPRYVVDLRGRLSALSAAANANADARAEDLQVSRITLAGDIAETWLRLVAQNQRLAIVDRQLATNQDVLTLVGLRFRQGLGSGADVLRQEAQVAGLEAQRHAAQALRARLGNQLRRLVPSGVFDPSASVLPTLGPTPDPGAPLGLITRRPDLRAAAARLSAADADLAAALADRFPQLVLELPLSTTAATLGGLLDTVVAGLSLVLTQTLHEGGVRPAEIDRTTALRMAAWQEWRSAILTAVREVEDALVNESADTARLAAVQTNAALDRAAFERLRDRYAAGAATYLDVLAALSGAQRGELAVLDAQLDRILTRIALIEALGGGDGAVASNPVQEPSA
jgi:NodT family efflux transporter outer membrane factor (OMF) lipoprotein